MKEGKRDRARTVMKTAEEDNNIKKRGNVDTSRRAMSPSRLWAACAISLPAELRAEKKKKRKKKRHSLFDEGRFNGYNSACSTVYYAIYTPKREEKDKGAEGMKAYIAVLLLLMVGEGLFQGPAEREGITK